MQVKCKSERLKYFDLQGLLIISKGVQVLLSAPNQKESLWRLFLILQVILRGLEPGKVSAFGKCADGTFSAGSARAVPHAKRGVTRA